MSKQKQALRRLREMMNQLFEIRYGGADAVRIARAQGLADGYMRALSDLGAVKEWELLDLVDEERRLVGDRIDARSLPSLRPSTAPSAV